MFNIDSEDTDYVLPGTPPDPNQRHSFLNTVYRSTTSTPTATASTSNEPEVQALNYTVLNEQAGKKRVRDESTWKKNVLKQKRVSGVEHVSKSGKIIPARVTGENCQCKFHCFVTVPQNVQEDIVTNFNKAADKNMQDMYLSGLISIKKIQRRRPKTGEGQKRAYACHYKVKLGDFETTVCKKAFCSFHGISKTRIERIVKCLHTKNALPKDNRGKHDNRPTKIPQHVIDTIDEHIKSFPREKSHYSKAKNDDVCYLSPDLNIKKSHRLYLQKYEPDVYAQLEKGEKCHPTVTYDYYRRHFVTKYKLCFGTPTSEIHASNVIC